MIILLSEDTECMLSKHMSSLLYICSYVSVYLQLKSLHSLYHWLGQFLQYSILITDLYLISCEWSQVIQLSCKPYIVCANPYFASVCERLCIMHKHGEFYWNGYIFSIWYFIIMQSWG